ncbi:MAG: bifunctional methylenetetrahydrofolate dehydrogenase/methenyltetrahydrofolate cyclohydrolase FolD [Rhodospirillaceae bacterium]|nr:bifunctional methylenetetrahydrofolate dehydrogenase/methenyltetrahydrofolate cyclohydrolase FolD [Rhodospirillaceae bacterium]
MKANIIDGKAIANNLRNDITLRVAEIKKKYNRIPCLATIIVGKDPASQIYVKSKEKRASECGIDTVGYKLPVDVTEANLLSIIHKLNNDYSINGILVQLPLPSHIDTSRIISGISATKDVDGFHPFNVGALASGHPNLVPCTPLGCKLILKKTLTNLSGLNAVVVGRSTIVGKPIANLLLAENCTVTITHSFTQNLPIFCKEADILIAAVGQPEFIKGDWIKPGATVIDVGINRKSKISNGKKNAIVGDVNFVEAADKAGAITPVPGGVGPMTIACLLQNTLSAFISQNSFETI